MKVTPNSNMLRKVVRRVWAETLCRLGILAWAESRLAKGRAVVVLTFHRVLSAEEYVASASPRGMLVKEQTFRSFLNWASKDFPFVRVNGEQQPHAANAGRPALALTFDDGWIDNFVRVAPLTKAANVPLTIFVCSGSLELTSPFWPERLIAALRAISITALLEILRREHSSLADRLQKGGAGSKGQRDVDWLVEAAKTLEPKIREALLCQLEAACSVPSASVNVDQTMSRSQLKYLRDDGIEIGSHTVSHAILPQLSHRDARKEIFESKQALEDLTGKTCDVFSYPNGTWSEAVRNLVAEAGYRMAFINSPGLWTSETDVFLIPRVNVWEGTLTGLNECFSPTMFRYAVIWKAYRAQLNLRKRSELRVRSAVAGCA